VDFELTDEQRLLRQTLRAFVDEQIRPVAQEMEASGAYPDEIVAGLAGLGLFGLTIPEEYGGLGADMCPWPSSSRRSRAAGWAWPASSAATPCRAG
jgi:alkylation response protein AidB-like acyl-CoA dehydrogenase